jgi:UMF1 family MFS transporter
VRAASVSAAEARRYRRGQAAWCFFDWANSAFPTVIVTFVFAAYFTRGVAADEEDGTALWAWAQSVSGLAIALASPVFGAIADRTGRRKPWLAAFSALCVAASALLWYAEPDPSYALYALAVFALANFAFEVGTVFYNAMLTDIAPRDRLGRLSGWGWGLGYFGGLTCLVVTLLVFVQADPPALGLDKARSEHVRIVGPLVAMWFAAFAVPLFLWTPDRGGAPVRLVQAAADGLRTLAATLRQVRRYGDIAKFLLARLFYVDGMNTLFAFGGVYAAGTFGMDFAEIIQFGIALNVTAGLGAIAFAWIDDWIGGKRTVIVSLAGLIALGVPLLFVEGKTLFWLLALPLGIFMGPAQAASRSLMARLAPPALATEMFGLFAFSGKATAFLGPAALGWATLAFASQRAGMATVIGFLSVGLALMFLVREPGAALSAGSGGCR